MAPQLQRVIHFVPECSELISHTELLKEMKLWWPANVLFWKCSSDQAQMGSTELWYSAWIWKSYHWDGKQVHKDPNEAKNCYGNRQRTVWKSEVSVHGGSKGTGVGCFFGWSWAAKGLFSHVWGKKILLKKFCIQNWKPTLVLWWCGKVLCSHSLTPVVHVLVFRVKCEIIEKESPRRPTLYLLQLSI